jgi:hypothetical protein
MITFADLSISNPLYKIPKYPDLLDTVDEYGNCKAKNALKTITIQNLRISDQKITINVDSYSNGYSIPFENKDSSQYETKDGIYFSDLVLANSVLKSIVLLNIQRCKDDIVNTTSKNEDKIKGLRQAYWDLLNNGE